VAITESWLNSSVPDGMLDPESKDHDIGRDRQTSIGGGVFIFVRRHLSAGEVQLDARSDLEICCVDVQLCNVQYRISGVYRPPHSETLAECLRI
jgi:hypothetical protein